MQLVHFISVHGCRMWELWCPVIQVITVLILLLLIAPLFLLLHVHDQVFLHHTCIIHLHKFYSHPKKKFKSEQVFLEATDISNCKRSKLLMPLGNLSNVIICRMILLTLQKFICYYRSACILWCYSSQSYKPYWRTVTWPIHTPPQTALCRIDILIWQTPNYIYMCVWSHNLFLLYTGYFLPCVIFAILHLDTVYPVLNSLRHICV